MSMASETARRLAREAEAVCRAYLPAGRRQGRWWQVGDVAGTPGNSLYVRLFGERAGHWTDSATGEHGDLLDLIALNRALSLSEALDEARTFLRTPHVSESSWRSPAPGGSPEAARRLFAASRPIGGTLAERYLRHRGIALPAEVSALRFHPRCWYRAASGRQTWPALIAAVTDLEGRITGLQRTWLDPSGGGKAPVDQPRRALGSLLGHGVRFGRVRDLLAAGEGVETMLALQTVLPGLAVVAALSAAHLGALILPPGLRRLYVARDNDDAGQRALARLIDRSPGLDIRPLVPLAEDFNADLLTLGADRLRDRIVLQLAPDDAGHLLSDR